MKSLIKIITGESKTIEINIQLIWSFLANYSSEVNLNVINIHYSKLWFHLNEII